ncbi:MAG: hypothetical protein H8E12_14680 [Rhodobacteraceae bacterium]|nr:hypothetical protein [Paracoccaceae bacterium]
MNIEGTHKGNAVDVYVHDPENIQTGSITTTLDSDTLSTAGINGIHPYIQEFVELRQHISQTVLDPSTYSIVSDATGKAFSKDADFKIFFLQDNIIGSRIDLVYKYWTGGETVTSYLTNDANRVPGSDLLVKVMPPHFITVSNLEYSGGLPPITMREALSTKINSNTATRIDKSDVIKMLYDFGATYVNTSFVLTIEEVTPEFVSKPHTVSDTYEISEATVGRFFTSPQRLLGMTQQ